MDVHVRAWPGTTRRLLAVTAAAVLMAVAGCGSAKPGGGNDDAGPVRVAAPQLTSLDPFSDDNHSLRRLGFEETLTTIDDGGANVGLGMLASAKRTQPRVWTLVLRPDVRFQDGSQVDAAAVVACLKLDAQKNFARDDVATGSFTVTGKLSFTITTRAVVGDLLSQLAAFANYPIFDSAAYRAAGGDLASLVNRGIFTGPFEPTSLTRTGLTAKANPDYWGGKVRLPGEQVLFVADPEAGVAAVQDGQADIALEPPTSAAATLKGDNRAFLVTSAYPVTSSYVMINQNPGSVLADPLVRRAVLKAIDYPALVAGLGPGVEPAASIFPSFIPYAKDTQTYDPGEAKALLDQAGWKPGPGGIRVKNGHPLSFTYLWSTLEDPINGDLGLALQQQLKAAGIDMKIRQAEESWDVPKNPSGWGMTAVRIQMIGGGSPYNVLDGFVTTGAGSNLGGIHDPELDSLVAALDSATTLSRRNALLAEIQTVIADDAGLVVLSHHAEQFVVDAAYKNFRPAGFLQDITYDLAPTG